MFLAHGSAFHTDRQIAGWLTRLTCAAEMGNKNLFLFVPLRSLFSLCVSLPHSWSSSPLSFLSTFLFFISFPFLSSVHRLYQKQPARYFLFFFSAFASFIHFAFFFFFIFFSFFVFFFFFFSTHLHFSHRFVHSFIIHTLLLTLPKYSFFHTVL